MWSSFRLGSPTRTKPKATSRSSSCAWCPTRRTSSLWSGMIRRPADLHSVWLEELTWLEVSVTQETFRAPITDIARSMKAHGFRHVILMGDSGGNRDGGSPRRHPALVHLSLIH